ncbi:hypothetical protein [Pseudonocardia nigra]|nr:hypothetical protein [Pseudonocardia nigra]
MAHRYVRYQSPVPNERGHHSGVFALANALGRAGVLSPVDHEFWRTTNDW